MKKSSKIAWLRVLAGFQTFLIVIGVIMVLGRSPLIGIGLALVALIARVHTGNLIAKAKAEAAGSHGDDPSAR